MTTVYLGLGSNLGDREANIKKALASLAPEITVTKISKMYETGPMYNTAQPKFLNGAIEGATELSAPDVLKKIKSIEREMGEHAHNEPRIIDLDLLFYGNEVIDTAELIVPHPNILERPFVLVPMNDIAPDLMHPVRRISIHRLLQNMDLRNP